MQRGIHYARRATSSPQAPSDSAGLRPQRPLVYERLSDPILVKRAKDGDAQALATLCERHAPRVERLAGHLLADPEDARDAAQESLAKLCVRIRQFRGESQFATWLHRLVVNTCRDVAERQRVRRCEPLLEDERAARRRRSRARGCRSRSFAASSPASSATLSPEQASVVVLKDAFGFSFAEISAQSRDAGRDGEVLRAPRARPACATRLADEHAA